MNLWRIVTLIFLCAVLTASCAGLDNPATENGGVGTTVNKPKPSTLTLFPNFEEAFPDAALGAVTVSETSYLTTGTTTEMSETAAAINQVWNDLFVNGPVREARLMRTQLTPLGENVAQLLGGSGPAQITDDPQTVTLSDEMPLADTSGRWTIEVQLEASHSDYLRYYFRNDEELILATLIVTHDADQNPVRGLFVYVNPARLNGEASQAKELVFLAFDLTDAESHLFSLGEIDFLFTENTTRTYLFLEDCSPSSGQCLGEYLELATDSNTRQINQNNNWRFSTVEDTREICLADVDYTGNATVFFDTYAFTGPTPPADNQVAINTCTVGDPSWGDKVFSEIDLPLAYEDTDPLGGTALPIYIDGNSKTGWDGLTPDLIDFYLQKQSTK